VVIVGRPDAGAHFEISIDGKPRSYRDDPKTAAEGAKYLKFRNPKSTVILHDMRTNVSTIVEWAPDPIR
jgi:hypothetical protein